MLAAIVVSTLIIGHRGASGHLPENTLPAFSKAIEMGADGIELDIWPDADGVPVVIHDRALTRTTGRDGDVTVMRHIELETLEIPSYRQVLDLMDGRAIIFTELKGAREHHVAEAILKAVESGTWRHTQLPVIGFDHDQLVRLREAYPAIPIGISFSRRMVQNIRTAQHADHMIAAAQKAGAYAINPDYRLVTAEMVEKAHAAGLKVNVWTVNDARAMRSMLTLGVDAIMTDFPDRLHGIIHADE